METPSPDPPFNTKQSATVGEFGAPREGEGFVHRRINLVKLAEAQRSVIFSIIAYFAVIFAVVFIPGLRARGPAAGTSFDTADFVVFAAAIVVAVCAIRLALAYGMGLLLGVLLGIAMAFPCVGLLLLFVVNVHVDEVLKHAGVRVGLLGVRSEEMRKLRVGICRGCGYDMRGLPSTRCPECGSVIQA